MTTYTKVHLLPYPSRATQTQRNFILQQGLGEPSADRCDRQYSSLLFQPRLLAFMFIGAALLQAPDVFFSFCAVLLWSAMVPRLNPFDALYNRVVAPSSGITLTIAPAPRRFSQFLGGSFALAIEVSQTSGLPLIALVLEVILLAAIAAVLLGGFCTGTFVYHVLHGRADFALRTVPWSTRA